MIRWNISNDNFELLYSKHFISLDPDKYYISFSD